MNRPDSPDSPDHPGSADLAGRLDRSFGDGPPQPTVGATLTAGRRALMRRRSLIGLSALAVLAVVGVGAALASGGGPSASEGIEPAAESPSTPSGETVPDAACSADCTTTEIEVSDPRIVPSDPRADVELLPDGSVARAVGVRVNERVPNPLGLSDPDRSIGIEYTRGGDTTWALLTYEAGRDGSSSGSISSDPAGKSFATLVDWIADQVSLQQGTPTLALVRFGDGETLLPRAGVQIVQQTGGVDLGSGFAGPEDRSAVAEVSYDGRRWYVLARALPGSPPEYFPTDAAVGGATLDDFLTYAAQQYAEGGGGLR